MNDFKLSCCRLFEQYPLYEHRVPTEDGETQRLHVLLIGYGSRIETILQAVMTQGQLLHTDLTITIANSNAQGTCDSLLKRAPYLPHAARLFVNATPVSDPNEQDLLCTLHFDDISLTPAFMPQVLESHCASTYVIISTGNDAKNRSLAEACAQVPTEKKRLVTYVQKSSSSDLEVISPMTEVHAWGSGHDESYLRQFETIALNMHYVYKKAQNSRTSCDTILREFDEPYTYTSNLEAALHIRAKLACCDITDDDLSAAASKFYQRIRWNPEIIDQLSALEHRRWLLSKVLDGYSPMPDINLIYRGTATTHDKQAKWHCCLVTCDPSGRSRLTEDDWNNTEKTIRPELDDLDKISLRIHAQCRKISDMIAPQVDFLLESIRKTLADNPEYSSRTNQIFDVLERSILQMRQHKQSVIAHYYKALGELRDQAATEGGILSNILTGYLNSLETATLPLIEYVSKKDYKLQDRILVEQIPFCLTHKMQPTLIKTLSANNTDNLFSFQQLEPARLVYLGSASGQTELLQIRKRLDVLRRFIRNSGCRSDVSCFVCVPPDMYAAEMNADIKATEYTLVSVSDWTLRDLSDALHPLIEELQADYLDVTGGDPLLTRAAERCAESFDVATFYIKNGQMMNLCNAGELSFPAPSRELTIKDMFYISGAIQRDGESLKMSDLSTKYRELYSLQQERHVEWAKFCRLVDEAYRKTEKTVGNYTFQPRTTRNDQSVKTLRNASGLAVKGFLPVMRKMEQLGIIENISITKDFGDFYEITYTANSCYAPPKELDEYLNRCVQAYQPSHHYSYSAFHRTLSCDELCVKDMPLQNPDEGLQKKHCEQILDTLEREGLIRDLRYTPGTNTCDFRFSSVDVKNCLVKAGNVLEYFVYYTALIDCAFTDVDMGFEFYHYNSNRAPVNELDIVCTKGLSSMFISCKARSMQFFEENLNYVIYEVSLLAEKFGINPKICIAAPALKQFERDYTGKRVYSTPVYKCLSRGVYLLGNECLKDSATLSQVLTNIMDGKENWCDFIA